MSSHINGLYFDCHTMDEVLFLIHNIQDDINQIFKKQYFNDLSSTIIKSLFEFFSDNIKCDFNDQNNDELSFFNFHQYEVFKNYNEKNGNWDCPEYNFTIYFFYQNQYDNLSPYMGVYNSSNNEATELLKSHDKVKEYEFYNSTDDQLNYLTYDQWQFRKNVWESLIPSNNIKQDSLMLFNINETYPTLNDTNGFKDYILKNQEMLINNAYKDFVLNQSISLYCNQYETTMPPPYKIFEIINCYDQFKNNPNYEFNNEEQKYVHCFRKAEQQCSFLLNYINKNTIEKLVFSPKKNLNNIQENIDLNQANQNNKLKKNKSFL